MLTESTGIMHWTQGSCIGHRDHALDTGIMHRTQGSCKRHRDHAKDTGIVRRTHELCIGSSFGQPSCKSCDGAMHVNTCATEVIVTGQTDQQMTRVEQYGLCIDSTEASFLACHPCHFMPSMQDSMPHDIQVAHAIAVKNVALHLVT